jgi:polysaccharide deacetylase family protein (PEP-CTERM system associated)
MKMTISASPIVAVLSVDVEDWFHILDLPSTPRLDEWAGLESRVERGFLKLLEIISAHEVRATWFFLGWVAKRYPHLVKTAVAGGHEIASHGYAHGLIFQHTRHQFRDDISRSKKLLEDLTGQPILGYRAPGFSATAAVPWFFEEVAAAGYSYDASIFPARRNHGGIPDATHAPHVVSTSAGKIVEFPASVTSLLGLPMSFFGGGYLRLFPLWLIRRMSYKALKEHGHVNFYIHPREVDPGHPRLPMNLPRKFRSYVGLRTTEKKLRLMIAEFKPARFQDVLPTVSQELLTYSVR